MAAVGGGGRRAWVVDVERTLSEADASVEVSRWQRHCIYRVPACIKDLNPKAYRPQVVSLGPLHHGDAELLPMEEHKLRALRHLLRRAKRPLEEFAAAVEEVAEQLESAYMDLGAEWCGLDGGREKFLEMMIVDGCFLLEVMRAADPGVKSAEDYASNDPIFSRHGVLYMVPYIRRDMLMLENQLPLLLLEKLVAVETAKPQNDDVINMMVLRFLSPASRRAPTGAGLRLHPLDVYRRSMLYSPHPSRRSRPDVPETDIIRSAVELYEAGIRFKKSNSECLHDIRFRHGVLSMPAVSVDDSTEYMFLNMMAFERLHVGAGNDVTAYIFFMDNIIDSAKDVALLSSKGIIQNAIGSDKAVAKLFNSISKDVVIEPESALESVQRQVNAYFRKPWNMWRANLIHTYFRSPWAFLSLLAAVFLLVMTIMQTVYTVMPFYKGQASSSSPAAPAPM
ncbi:UPF0481 protein At3g47200-like [Phragmites australis]|uniref:UPF0481 protein At3g47200-like n=1 Tax=Phragmites australis TaxID=29695 RepID=UPI002D78AE2C|nr:UPF0481 protein At3g47200-like [Phragmites australis]